MLPGILAVQNHRDEGVCPAGSLREPPARFDQTADEIVGGPLGGPARIGEADEIREHVIAKRAHDAGAADAESIRRVEPLGLFQMTCGITRERRTKRARQNQLVGRHPLEPGGLRERHHGVGDRAFRRPQPLGPPAEDARVVRRRALQLFGRVFRMLEAPRRPSRVGMRAQVDVGVAQERQDRVIERRGGDLDLPAHDAVPVFGDDLVQDLELHVPQHALVVLAEAASLGEQAAHAIVDIQVERIDPRQLVPDLQIAQVVDRVRRGPTREQLRVAWVDVDHPLPLRVEEVRPHELDLVSRQIGRRLHAQLERPIARAVLGERFQLHEERRHQVERDLDRRELAQDRRHAEIIFEGMQADPRQDVLAGDQVLVERLVHVPQQGDARHTV